MTEGTETQNTQTEKKDSEEKIDWEKRYKDGQAALTQAQQKAAEHERTIENLYPYVNWDAASGQEKPAANTEEETAYVTKKDLDALSKQMKQQFFGHSQAIDFKLEYPDMRDYENEITAIFQNQTDQRKPPKQRIADAVDLMRKRIAHIGEEAIKEAETKRKEKEAQEAQAAGLEGRRTAAKEEESAETPKQYTEALRARQEQKKITKY